MISICFFVMDERYNVVWDLDGNSNSTTVSQSQACTKLIPAPPLSSAQTSQFPVLIPALPDSSQAATALHPISSQPCPISPHATQLIHETPNQHFDEAVAGAYSSLHD